MAMARGSRIASRGVSRPLWFVLALLSHIAVVCILITGSDPARQLTAEGTWSSPIYVMPIDSMPIVDSLPSPHARGVGETPRQADATEEVASIPVPMLGGEDPAEINTAHTNTVVEPESDAPQPRTDWHAGMQRVARESALARPGYQHFGPVAREQEPSLKVPKGIFERGSPFRAGDIQKLDMGAERHWISSRCFREFGHVPELFGYRPKVVPVTCLGPSAPNSDLFDHLKPEYLKSSQ